MSMEDATADQDSNVSGLLIVILLDCCYVATGVGYLLVELCCWSYGIGAGVLLLELYATAAKVLQLLLDAGDLELLMEGCNCVGAFLLLLA
ncbi:hypothetical protein LINPERHAP2_LOCUS4761 [Linum perenne]